MKLNEKSGDELVATAKRQQHINALFCSDSPIPSEFVRRVHGMMDNYPGK
ncbi:unnamed protein product [Hymenolepis diminuta]|uniref:Uncharacterized protein n=1 Tax=Hymenolepis diminuta TaxID=6216 RepID=A0A564YNL3_HYMDI|nr:unnamed protein product [Hymenolepis diminuta]